MQALAKEQKKSNIDSKNGFKIDISEETVEFLYTLINNSNINNRLKKNPYTNMGDIPYMDIKGIVNSTYVNSMCENKDGVLKFSEDELKNFSDYVDSLSFIINDLTHSIKKILEPESITRSEEIEYSYPAETIGKIFFCRNKKEKMAL